MALSALAFGLLVVAAGCNANGFGYFGDDSPEHWGEHYDQCNGKLQSPIDIKDEDVTRAVLPPFKLENFYIPASKAKITNNGHTVMLSMTSDNLPRISGGPLSGQYEFSQLHFHWGEDDDLGSEDMVNDKSYPMEAHAVFFKKAYGDATAALDHSDGLTVLAFFFERNTQANSQFNEFETLLSNVTTADTEALFTHPPLLTNLLPLNSVHYYTYNGSLTTPPCSEVVTWIDFTEPISLSHAQIKAFRALRDEEGRPMTHNYRPSQPLNGRRILFNMGEDALQHAATEKGLWSRIVDEFKSIPQRFQSLPQSIGKRF